MGTTRIFNGDQGNILKVLVKIVLENIKEKLLKRDYVI